MKRVITRVPSVSLATIEEYVGWMCNAVLTGVSCKRRAHSWLVVVKADFKSGPMVAFIEGKSLHEALVTVDAFAEGGHLQWYPDKFPGKSYRRGVPSG